MFPDMSDKNQPINTPSTTPVAVNFNNVLTLFTFRVSFVREPSGEIFGYSVPFSLVIANENQFDSSSLA